MPKKPSRMSPKSAKIVGSKPPPATETDAGVTEGVVAPPFVGIAEHAVCLGGLLEALLRALVPGILVGMVLEREPSIGRLDFLLGGAARNAEDLVVISLFADRHVVLSGTRDGARSRQGDERFQGRSIACPMRLAAFSISASRPRSSSRLPCGWAFFARSMTSRMRFLLVGGELAFQGLDRAHRVGH